MIKDNHYKIFISYTLRDNVLDVEFLTTLHNQLQSFCKPFIDIIHNDSIEKQLRIEEELKNSKMMILLESIGSNNSHWVNREIEIAIANDIPIKKIQIIENSLDIAFVNKIADNIKSLLL